MAARGNAFDRGVFVGPERSLAEMGRSFDVEPIFPPVVLDWDAPPVACARLLHDRPGVRRQGADPYTANARRASHTAPAASAPQ